MLTTEQMDRIRQIERRLDATSASRWRNAMRRETPEQVATLLRDIGGLGKQRCSGVVVNTATIPKADNVIC